MAKVYWLIQNSEQIDWDACMARLSPACRARAAQFTHPQRQRNFVAGRSLLAQALAHLGETSHYQLQLTLSGGLEGQPRLVNSAWQFSLSYSQNWLALALAQFPIGLDIEVHRPRPRERLLAHYYHPSEAEYIADAVSEAAKQQAFFALWTGKEALIKVQAGSVLQVDSLPALQLPLLPTSYYRLAGDLFYLQHQTVALTDKSMEKTDDKPTEKTLSISLASPQKVEQMDWREISLS